MDRELLEMAAKAAGELHLVPYREEWLAEENFEGWNPLRFDGDALRLAVKLEFTVHQNSGASGVSRGSLDGFVWERFDSESDLHRLPSTRRAIVRAAAEIGRAM